MYKALPIYHLGSFHPPEIILQYRLVKEWNTANSTLAGLHYFTTLQSQYMQLHIYTAYLYDKYIIYIYICAPNIYITFICLYTYTPYNSMHIYLYMASDLLQQIASNVWFSRRKAPSAPPERPKSAGSRWGTRVERGFYEEGRCLRKIHSTMILQESIVNSCQFFTTRCRVAIFGVLVYSCVVSFCVLSCIFGKSKPHGLTMFDLFFILRRLRPFQENEARTSDETSYL